MDIYLKDAVCWRNIPPAGWEYAPGGYQVIKKWLSYRKWRILGHALKLEEAGHVSEVARRIAAIRLLQPELDANYQRIKADTFPWPQDRD